jgi:anti-sigma factor RsiW
MRFSDETLIAFADGALDEPTRRAVERAMRTDPALAAKVKQHMAMRDEVFRAFARTLHDPAPPRLHVVEQSAKVVQLDSMRMAKKEVVETAPAWSWPEWGAIGVAAVVGVLAGALGFVSLQGEIQLATAVGDSGVLAARGKLDTALSRQLASAPGAGAGVRIGVSFVARDGQYCRTFGLGSSAGLACRAGGEWKIPVLAEGGAVGAMPAAVLAAVDARAVGTSLDVGDEQAAMQRGWKR